ncbi:MAG TPA: fused response regulator/phosphatase [Pseudomonadales bacterium]
MPDETPLKVLIADDSNSDRLLLNRIIEKQGHVPLQAADGVQAIEVFERERPDIILLDALMPRLDGFETARYIKSHSGEQFIPIIFLTSLNEADSLAQCLEAGGDDFLTKPYNHIILQAKINAFRRMLKMHVTLQQQRDQIAANNQRMIQEQEVAKRTFDKVAHEGSLHAPNIRYTLSPMAIFNGDVLLAAIRPNGNLCVLLGDFTGHGLAAAIGAMPLSQTFYSMVAKGFAVRDIVTELNRKLKEILPVGVFCCAVMVDMDFRNKLVEIWAGGMPDSYLYRPDSRSIVAVPSTHLALGILEHERFRANTYVYAMANGDRLFLWSDGIVEASNARGELFGEQRLRDIFARTDDAGHLFDVINQTVNRFIADTDRSDDLSIAEISMVDQAVFDGHGRLVPKALSIPPTDWSFSFEVRPVTLRCADPLPILQKILSDLPGLRPRSGELFTVLSELYSNALEHGLLGLESAIKASSQGFTQYYKERARRLESLQDGFIRFDIEYRAGQAGSRLTLVVTDSGKGFDVSGMPLAGSEVVDYSGRGLHLIYAICSRVEYLGNGNQVKVVFDW